MNRRILSAAGAATLVAMAGACSGVEKSSNPLTPTVQGPIPGVNISAPSPIQPVNGQRMRSDQQPITLTIANSVTSGVRPLSYVFEIAADTGFTNIVYKSASVGAGANGQTMVRLTDSLASDRSYHWRARAEDGANTGPNSATADFNIFTPVVFQAPTPIDPINNNTVSSLRPRFTFRNADRTGSPDAVAYLVEVSDSASFAVSATANVAEQPGQTSITAPQDLPGDKQLFWHVRAFDSTATGPWSAVASFRTVSMPPVGGSPCSYPGHPSTWSTDVWHDCFFSLIQKRNVGPVITIAAMGALRGDLLAMDADWQNGWRGDYRPRLFLPVPGCSPTAANNPSPPSCAFDRTVDIGDFGGAWQWIPR